MTAGGVAPAAPAGLCGGPLGRAGPDLRGTDPKAALSAGPSCSSPPPGAEALSSSDPPHSSACATTGGRRARCTRRTLHAHAPPGTLQATRTRMGGAPSHTHGGCSKPHAHAPPGTPGWGTLQAVWFTRAQGVVVGGAWAAGLHSVGARARARWVQDPPHSGGRRAPRGVLQTDTGDNAAAGHQVT